MISILHPITDEVVKVFDNAKYMHETDVLKAYLKYISQISKSKRLSMERKLVLMIRAEIRKIFTEHSSGSCNDFVAFYTELSNSETIREYMHKLLIASYERDRTNFADFNLHPNTLEPFRWLMPILNIDYSDKNNYSNTRVDWSAFYYLKFVCGGGNTTQCLTHTQTDTDLKKGQESE